MKYQLTLDQKPGYLHAVVTGPNSRENVERYVEDLKRECIGRNCFRVLIEERLEGPRLKMVDVFEIASDGSRRFGGAFEAVAYVDVNRIGDLMQFAETVATNRGLALAVFSTVAEAERWLLDQNRASSEAGADTLATGSG